MIKVLDLSSSSTHSANIANIHGDFDVTRMQSLVGIDLSLYDVFYVGEHDSTSFYSGREADIAAEITAGRMGFIAENDATWAVISMILGETVTNMTDVPPLNLTAAGIVHPTFTGQGIDGGNPVVIANIIPEDAFSAIPSGATVLMQDSAGNPVTFVGKLGAGNYFISGIELTESGTGPSSTDDIMLGHNAIHFAVSTPPVVIFGSSVPSQAQGDVLLQQTPDDGEITVENGIIELTSSFETSVYLSLFGGNSEGEWWGNEGVEDSAFKIVSRTAQIIEGMPLTTGNLVRLKEAVELDLKWMLDKKIASKVGVVVTIPGLNKVKISILIQAEGKISEFNFTENWLS